MQNYQISHGNIWGRGLFLCGQTQGDGVPSLPSFCFAFYAYTLCRRTIKFEVVTLVGEGRVSWVSNASHSKRPQPSLILMFSCIYDYIL